MPSTPIENAQLGSPRLRNGAGGQVWWCRGPAPVPFELRGGSYVAEVKLGLTTSPYATLDDLVELSIPEDQAHDFDRGNLERWLRVGAARVNEYLGQRFDVPLRVWSDTVVFANCEIAYFGAARRRGQNTEAMLSDFRAREADVLSWLKGSRDHEITPDPRLSAEDQPKQGLQYVGPPGRGWDFGRGSRW